MAILTQDIKILKSAVMNDSTDGGGRMTGVAVVDGQSNSLFPDTSAMDRAFGRVQMRKVFGVAHTNDTDTLMGAHSIITDTPDDPNVHCTLMKTPNWGDQRNTAKELIERYLVKGPRMSWRIYDTHYAGSAKLRLYAFTNLPAPASGESLCLINPNGQELYVRILRTKTNTEQVYLQEGGGGTVAVTANFVECDLSQTLSLDVYGPPIMRVGLNEQQYAMLYSTTLANGVKFYGTKPLGFVGQVGDYGVTTSSGIFTPLVPAATIETPIVDQYPLIARSAIAKTGYTNFVSDLFAHSNIATTPISLPVPVSSNTFEMRNASGNTLFCKDDGVGVLVSDGVEVGTIDYLSGTVKINKQIGFNGYYSYKPASRISASTRSDGIVITQVNQGLSFTKNIIPAPAPSSVSVHYMAQGRWYSLTDNGNGKLSGSDTGYGVGSVNYDTGSVLLNLGAMPDVGSVVIFEWGALALAKQVPTVPSNLLPEKLTVEIPMNTGRVSKGTLKFKMGNGIEASINTYGESDIQGFEFSSKYDALVIKPHILTDSIEVTYQEYGEGQTQYTIQTSNQITLSGFPIAAGTVQIKANLTFPQYGGSFAVGETRIETTITNYATTITDRNGKLYAYNTGGRTPAGQLTQQEVGTINYATGAIVLTGFSVYVIARTYSQPRNGRGYLYDHWETSGQYYSSPLSVVSVNYGGALSDVKSLTVTPVWTAQLPNNFLTSGTVATIYDKKYFARNGVLYTDWNALTGAGVVNGTVNNAGVYSPVIPASLIGQANAITWQNAAFNTVNDTVMAGVFRTSNSPLKEGSLQMAVGVNPEATARLEFVVDAQRGIVWWRSPDQIAAADLRYNTVYLEYLPLEASILGLNTARLPLDGKVPVYRSGDLCVVHNTLTLNLPNPLVKGTAYAMRERLASVRVKDALGVVVPDTKYELDLNAGTITFPVGISITSYAQPFTVEHRIEDLLLCSQADISGRLRFTRSLTHNFPANTSFVSSALPFGDLFARFYNVVEQQTWTNQWSDERIGGAMTANFNETDYPIVVSNRGTIKERWAVIFTGSTTFRVVGESVGEIGYGNTSDDCAPTNNATSAPYFVLPALGWGAGWSVGNVLRFNTDACGAPFWIVRTILQGPASVESDKFALAFRGDVDRP